MIRRLLRWLRRTVITLLVLFVLAALVDYFSHRIAADSVLLVTLQGPVVERARAGVLGLLPGRQTPLNLVGSALERAARDGRIVGLALKVVDPDMDLAQAQEIAAMVKAFRRHGKWTAAYLETAGEFESGNLPYLVASAAGEVTMMPQGELNLVGVSVRELFMRGTLDWLGIKPEFDAFGDYKTAMNIFTQKDFTPAQREQDDSLVSSLFEQIVSQTADERKIPGQTIRAIVDHAPLIAAAGLDAHLVDRLEYEDQFDDRVRHRGGTKHELVAYDDYVRPRLLPEIGFYRQIAVIYGNGAIERGEGGFDPLLSPEGSAMGSDPIGSAFKQAREDDRVAAVVFRINSPGGSVIASELIRRQVELTARKKPVVVSMSSYGASGGYWVATPAAKIIAEPGTITGSIGVLGGKFDVSAMAHKIGINTGAVARGANVEMFDPFTEFNVAQRKILHDQVLGNTYDYFLTIVGRDRHLPVDQVKRIAQGRVWTGAQAAKLKLVDKLGGLAEAVDEARTLAKIAPSERVGLVELPALPSVLEQILSGQLAKGSALDASAALPMLKPVRWLARALARGNRGLVGAAYCTLIPMI